MTDENGNMNNLIGNKKDGEILNKLEEAGIDVADLTARLMGNMNLITRFIKRFPDDKNYQQIIAGIESTDEEAAFRAAHSLKGVCANLSMTRLYKLLSEQVEALRAGDMESAAVLMPTVTEEYEKMVEAIRSIEWE